MSTAYLDNNATTRVDPRVVAAMLPFFTEQFGNASSIHEFGAQVTGALRQARKQVQTLLGAEFDHEIVFTSGGTESDSTAILSAMECLPDRDEIVTSKVEHPAILSVCQHLEKIGRAKVHYIGVDAFGRLDLEAFRAALSPRVALVTIMWANNETGTIFPIDGLADLAKEVGALFHTDAVQAVGKVPISLKDSSIDMLSLSGHKLHGPKGVGALYVKRGSRFKPLLRGGHQERGRRAGTENAPGIVALGLACELAGQHMAEENTRVKALRDRLEKGVLAAVPNCFANGDPHDRLPNTGQYRLRICRGRSDPAASQPRRDRRLVGLCLHLRLAGAEPRAARDEHPLHRSAWLDPFLAVARHGGGGGGPRDRSPAGDHRKTARALALLGRRAEGSQGLQAGLRIKPPRKARLGANVPPS